MNKFKPRIFYLRRQVLDFSYIFEGKTKLVLRWFFSSSAAFYKEYRMKRYSEALTQETKKGSVACSSVPSLVAHAQ